MAFKFPLLAVSAGVLLSIASQAHAAVGGTLTPLIGVAPSLAGGSYGSVTPDIVVGAPPDSTANHIDPNVSTSLFSGVVSVNINYSGKSYICSGTLVNSYQVVSAGHCVDTAAQGSPFALIDLSAAGNSVYVAFNSNGNYNTFSGGIVQATKVVADPNYLGFGNCPSAVTSSGAFCLNHDMSVITLGSAAPASAKTYSVLASPLSGPVPITMVGYGTTGTGDVGYTLNSASYSTKRQGQNYAEFYEQDDFQNFAGGANGVYYADFDGPTAEQNLFCTSSHASDWGTLCGPSLANNLESSIGGGDSGGAAFVLINGKYVLAANNTFSGTYPGQTGGTFGTYFGGITTGAELAFLTSATAQYGLSVVSVPEPQTYALMVLGLAGIGGFVRRRRTAQA